ncbi:MAG: radical SAM protein [Fervidicoccaceae archaeon]
MHREIRISRNAVIYGDRIAMGCSLCFSGAKAVIFVTGLCREDCYYCPISNARKGKDVFYVNEREVRSMVEMVAEVERSGASSASITGGDPLERLDRTLAVIETLKKNFGPSFHIHLYTNGLLARNEVLASLERAGLDEIRFHPTRRDTWKRIEMAKELTGMSVGAEIPAIPNTEEDILSLAEFLDKIGADFLNLNELEISESNFPFLQLKGFTASIDGRAVRGSAETALKVMKMAKELGLRIPIHFCPSVFKDEIQTKNRFLMTMKSDLKVFEKPTKDGTVLFGIIEGYDEGVAGRYLEEGILFPCRNDKLCFHPDDLNLIIRLGIGRRIELVESHPTVERFVINSERIL